MAIAARDKAHVVKKGTKKGENVEEKNGNNQKEEISLNRNKLS